MSSKHPSVVAAAPSQAQSTSTEPEQREKTPETAVKTATGVTGDDAETQYFDATVIKINADGNEVMSNFLAPGETLRRAQTDRYALSPKAAEKSSK